MSDCCSKANGSCSVPEEKGINTVSCPSCGQKGKTVDTQTVKALLSISLEAVEETATYRFCHTPDCPAVYFDAAGGLLFWLSGRCFCANFIPGIVNGEKR